MIRVSSSAAEFDSLRNVWDTFYNRLEKVSPFQSFAYCRAALPLLSGNLHIVTWLRKGEILAIFPFYVDSRRILRFINDSHSDFCGPLVMPEAEGDFHMCEEIAGHIRDCEEISGIRLENMRYDLFQTALQYQLRGSFLYCYKQYSHFAVSMNHLSTKEKYRLKNIAARMEREEARWCRFDASCGDPWPEELICSLTSSMIAAGIRKEKYFSGPFLEFIREIYESGAMMISATCIGDNPVSCNLCLKNGNEVIDWMALYREPHYNGWNLLSLIGWMQGNGFGTLNFARGIYPYKMHNYKPAVGSLGRLHWSKSFAGRLADTFECWVSQVKRMKRTR